MLCIEAEQRRWQAAMASLLSAAVSPIQKWPRLAVNPCDVCLLRQMAKLPNVCVIGKYPDSNLSLPFRNAHAFVREKVNQGSKR